MICINCDRSLKTESKICPYCGYVQDQHEIGATEHHNFGKDTALAHNLRLSDYEIPNYGFNFKKLADPKPLLTNVIFILSNLIAFFIYILFIYIITKSILASIITAIIVTGIGIILQLLFYKSRDVWYRGLVPVVNFLNLYKRFIRDYKAAYSVIYGCFFFSTIWVVLLFLVFALVAAGYMDTLLKVWMVFLELEIALLFSVFTVYNLKAFYNIGNRFGEKPIKVSLLFVYFIPLIAFNKKYYYIEEQIV